MTERENLFAPVHKGIRSMIYELGLRLGTTDFRDVAAGNRMAEDIESNLSLSSSNCFLCLLSAHSRHEERDFFAPLRPHDSDVVNRMVRQHREIVVRISRIARTCHELQAESDPSRRLEIGDRLHLDVGDLVVAYLAHLNDEEALLVPIMWENFTDEQLRAFRAQFYNRIPVARFEEWMRWTLPALNPHELVVLLRGMRSDPAPNRFEDAVRIAKEELPLERGALLEIELEARPPAS